jgi:predicted RNA-binding Zn ribbon-like protein
MIAAGWITCQDELEGYLEPAFQLVAGHPALDLVNTLDWRFREDGPEELLKDYSDLLRFTEQSKLLTPQQARQLRRPAHKRAGAQVLQRCMEVREALAGLFYTSATASLEKLERYFQAARQQQELGWKDSYLEWKWPEIIGAELPLWLLSLSASDLLTTPEVQRVRTCDNPDCRWLFLDTSKNHTRRWCDMKICGNRMKARRFKANKRN